MSKWDIVRNLLKNGQLLEEACYKDSDNLGDWIDKCLKESNETLKNISSKTLLKERRTLSLQIPSSLSPENKAKFLSAQNKMSDLMYSPVGKDISRQRRIESELKKISSPSFLERYKDSGEIDKFQALIDQKQAPIKDILNDLEKSGEVFKKFKNPEIIVDTWKEELNNKRKGNLTVMEKEQIALQAIESLKGLQPKIDSLSQQERDLETVKEIQQKSKDLIDFFLKEGFDEQKICKDAEQLLEIWPDKIDGLRNKRFLSGEKAWFAAFLDGVIDVENIRKKIKEISEIQNPKTEDTSKPLKTSASKAKKTKDSKTDDKESRGVIKSLKDKIRDLESEIEDFNRKVSDLEKEITDLNESLLEEKEANQKFKQKTSLDHQKELDEIKAKKDEEYSKYINPVKYKKNLDIINSQLKILNFIGINDTSKATFDELSNLFDEKNVKTIWELIDNASNANKDSMDWKKRTEESDQRRNKAEHILKEKLKEMEISKREIEDKTEQIFKLSKKSAEEIEYLKKKLDEYENIGDSEDSADEQSSDAETEDLDQEEESDNEKISSPTDKSSTENSDDENDEQMIEESETLLINQE